MEEGRQTVTAIRAGGYSDNQQHHYQASENQSFLQWDAGHIGHQKHHGDHNAGGTQVALKVSHNDANSSYKDYKWFESRVIVMHFSLFIPECQELSQAD